MTGINGIPIETRQKIDVHLKNIAGINSGIALDTTKSEKAELRKLINLELAEIKKLDEGFYNEIVPDKQDKI